MRYIPLSKGQFAIIDDEDFEELSKHKWYAMGLSGRFYAARDSWRDKKTILMHRQIMCVTNYSQQVDHKNGNSLDNQRSNLRICNNGQNNQNKPISTRNKSGFKGVSWNKDLNKWQSHIKVNYKSIYLGAYLKLEDAAKAYNEAAKIHHGEFACLNTVE